MLKKLVCFMLAVILVLSLSISVFADPTPMGPAVTPSATPYASPYATPFAAQAKVLETTKLDKAISDVSEETEEFYVDITMPDVEALSLTKRTYVITGAVNNADYSDVTVVLQVYDAESGSYIPMENTDGETQWEIGSFGVFSKEIKLKEGPNQIRLLIYRASQIDNITADDIQVDRFTITLLNSGLKNILNKAVEITSEILRKLKPN